MRTRIEADSTTRFFSRYVNVIKEGRKDVIRGRRYKNELKRLCAHWLVPDKTGCRLRASRTDKNEQITS